MVAAEEKSAKEELLKLDRSAKVKAEASAALLRQIQEREQMSNMKKAADQEYAKEVKQ